MGLRRQVKRSDHGSWVQHPIETEAHAGQADESLIQRLFDCRRYLFCRIALMQLQYLDKDADSLAFACLLSA